jgi:hypothetical protein
MMQSVRTWIAFGFLGLGFLYLVVLALSLTVVPVWLATSVGIAFAN